MSAQRSGGTLGRGAAFTFLSNPVGNYLQFSKDESKGQAGAR